MCRAGCQAGVADKADPKSKRAANLSSLLRLVPSPEYFAKLSSITAGPSRSPGKEP